MKTALVVGATGLVGSALVQQLLQDDTYSTIHIFVRREPKLQHPKLKVHVISFDDFVSWSPLVKGDVLFSALGTTLKQAGGKKAQYKIDYTYQYNFAAAAANNAVPAYVLISSAGANSKSRVFYSKMKGELEEAVKRLPFKSISIIQPGLLVGEREKERAGEKTAYHLLKFFNKMGLFKQYKPIQGYTVAKAMIQACQRNAEGVNTYSLQAVFSLAEGQ